MTTESDSIKWLPLIIKWGKKEITLDEDCIQPDDTVTRLKSVIYHKTGVKPDKQKLLGLKYKGKSPDDETKLADLNLKPSLKIMLIGSTDDDIQDLASTLPDDEVVNDLDIPDECEVPIYRREEFLSKVKRRVKEYRIHLFNQPREGKKLLVLDVDYTLFDHRSTAEHISQIARPYLHEFLTSAYEHYDIAIWSATGMKWIEVKMRELGIANNPNYKILFYLDNLAMIDIYSQDYGLLRVKPLGVIWGKLPQYSPKNTIMFDDVRRNFLMNPENGLRIEPFKDAYKNRQKDKELLYLSRYLKEIANEEDLSSLDHRHWTRVVPRK